MSGFVLSRRARRDLGEIWQFTAQRWGKTQAETYTGQLVRNLHEIADQGGPAQTMEIAGRRYLRSFVGSHVLICRRETDGRLMVVRILHQSMDVGRHLK